MDPQIPIQNTQQVALIVVPIVFDLLAIAAVALRVLARRVSNRRLDASDYVMFAALLFTTGFSGLLVAEAFTGGGLHMTWLVETYGGAPLVTYLKVRTLPQPFPQSWNRASTTDSRRLSRLAADDRSQPVPLGPVRLPSQNLRSASIQQDLQHASVHLRSQDQRCPRSVFSHCNHPRSPATMSASSIQLGPDHSRWPLRQPSAFV